MDTDELEFEKERKFEIEILTKHGIPVLTKNLVGKTVSYTFSGFIVFTDNTCFFADNSLGTIYDQDDISLSSYLNLWQKKFSNEVIQIKSELNWFEKSEIIESINNLPNSTDFNELYKKIKKLIE
ncbi:hypothetical protein BC351_00745 [Paenibacillus ferrarius]|uniref:Uncharacterized protein n=1 Tax=Paenibacillus ferrarius TaxID=1469647 RepID=A0A1V4HS91_9BACL|nr:hypothetical protein [Paenibacillus ferrarius]OPH61801.1 hypothetical protein BC351_00745 [Paenibacillus ferrarius]